MRFVTFEEIKEICRNTLGGYEKYDTSSADFIDNLNKLAKEIVDKLDISQLKFSIEHRDSNICIIYNFVCENKYKTGSGFVFNKDSFDNDLTTHIINIQNGCKAISIVNKIIDSRNDSTGNNIDIQMIWGNSLYSSIAYWDYKTIVIKLSKKSIQNLIELYRNGEQAFQVKIEDLIDNDIAKENIVETYKNIPNTRLYKELELEFNGNMQTELSMNMLSRKDAIQICVNNTSGQNLELHVVENIKQLGDFITLSIWNVDFKNKTISIKLKDEKVIDNKSEEIIYNYNICSRIEQSLALNDIEKSKIFHKSN